MFFWFFWDFRFSEIFHDFFENFDFFRKFLRSKNLDFFARKFSLKCVWKWKNLDRKFSKIFDLKNFENFHWKLYENEKFWDRKFSIFSDPKFLNAVRTQTDRAPRDFCEIASDQNVVKIMVFYFPKIYGFPMLRSTQNDQKLLLNLLSLDC